MPLLSVSPVLTKRCGNLHVQKDIGQGHARQKRVSFTGCEHSLPAVNAYIIVLEKRWAGFLILLVVTRQKW